MSEVKKVLGVSAEKLNTLTLEQYISAVGDTPDIKNTVAEAALDATENYTIGENFSLFSATVGAKLMTEGHLAYSAKCYEASFFFSKNISSEDPNLIVYAANYLTSLDYLAQNLENSDLEMQKIAVNWFIYENIDSFNEISQYAFENAGEERSKPAVGVRNTLMRFLIMAAKNHK